MKMTSPLFWSLRSKPLAIFVEYCGDLLPIQHGSGVPGLAAFTFYVLAFPISAMTRDVGDPGDFV